jgi:hypothetical protein
MACSLPNRESEQGRVDKGKSGQAQITAVSGGFGGGILSQDVKNRCRLFLGEQSDACNAVKRATIAVLLMDVLTGLGGASQEKSAARILFDSVNESAARRKRQPRFSLLMTQFPTR